MVGGMNEMLESARIPSCGGRSHSFAGARGKGGGGTQASLCTGEVGVMLRYGLHIWPRYFPLRGSQSWELRKNLGQDIHVFQIRAGLPLAPHSNAMCGVLSHIFIK